MFYSENGLSGQSRQFDLKNKEPENQGICFAY